MKTTLLFVIALFYSLDVIAQERAVDSFIAYRDRKVRTPKDSADIPYPWVDVKDIQIVFDYKHKQINIFAEKTLSITITGVDADHYLTPEGKSAIDMQAVDQRGFKCTVTFFLVRDQTGVHGTDLIIRFSNGYLEYKIYPVNRGQEKDNIH